MSSNLPVTGLRIPTRVASGDTITAAAWNALVDYVIANTLRPTGRLRAVGGVSGSLLVLDEKPAQPAGDGGTYTPPSRAFTISYVPVSPTPEEGLLSKPQIKAGRLNRIYAIYPTNDAGTAWSMFFDPTQVVDLPTARKWLEDNPPDYVDYWDVDEGTWAKYSTQTLEIYLDWVEADKQVWIRCRNFVYPDSGGIGDNNPDNEVTLALIRTYQQPLTVDPETGDPLTWPDTYDFDIYQINDGDQYSLGGSGGGFTNFIVTTELVDPENPESGYKGKVSPGAVGSIMVAQTDLGELTLPCVVFLEAEFSGTYEPKVASGVDVLFADEVPEDELTTARLPLASIDVNGVVSQVVGSSQSVVRILSLSESSSARYYWRSL